MYAIRQIAALAFAAWSTSAFALSAEGVAGDVHFNVYAPDWTWQGRDANIMVVLENSGDVEAGCTVSLKIPEEFRDHFGRNGAGFEDDFESISTETTISPGDTNRVALTGLTALHDFPLQLYELTVTIQTHTEKTVIPYPLQTIRGQAVSEGKAVALGVPIAVALLFSIAFAFVLRTSAAPDAWKKAGPPAEESKNPEPWIAATPK